MENKRMIETIKILSHASAPMSGPELSQQLGITVRTSLSTWYGNCF